MFKKTFFFIMVSVFAFMPFKAGATPPLKDYSHIVGVCHNLTRDQETLKRQLGYAKRVGINSTRIWLSQRMYERDPEAYLAQLKDYVRTSWEMGISTMPILFNGNNLDPQSPDILEEGYHKKGEKYARAVVECLKDEPGLLMWDIMNEPVCNDYVGKAPENEKAAREKKLWDFARHYIKFVKKLDPVNAVTVGVTYSPRLEHVADLVDVLSFHDYLETTARIENTYKVAEEYAAKYNKPLLNTEMGCIGRANPYDLAIEIAREHNVGFYAFTLMTAGYWSDIHGIFYPDGTVRDPAIVAALLGFYRNRDAKTRILSNANKEGYAVRGLEMIQKALGQEYAVFRNRRNSTDEILEAAEWCANLLESAELVPMNEPPSVKIRTWRAMPENERPVEEIRQFTYNLGNILKEKCQLY